MRTIKHSDGASATYEWDSYEEWHAEWVEFSKTARGIEHRRAHGYGSLFTDPKSLERWYGHREGFDATLNCINNGWPELRQKLIKLMEGVELDLPTFPSLTMTRRRKRRWNDEGDEYDQQRTWNGDLDHAWAKAVRTEKLQPNTKRVTLAFSVSDNGCVSNDQAMWRAALSLLLCDALARAGRVFEVWCIDSTESAFESYIAPRTLYSGWMVKASHEPAVMDRLAGMLGVGFLRTVQFMSQDMGPWRCSTSLGRCIHTGLPHTLEERRKGGEVVIRIAGCYSKQEAIARYAEAWREVETCTGAQPESDVA
jgi:hypothetical protein